MANHKHLTLDDRIKIETMLQSKSTFTEMAKQLDKDLSTISKEIRSHLIFKRVGGWNRNYNACIHRFSCSKSHICEPCHSRLSYKLCRSCFMCNRFCTDFQPEICKKLSMPPYVCNGCGNRRSCSLEKKFYEAAYAHKEYTDLRRECRSGISLSEEELRLIDELVSPLIRKQQSPHHICVTNKDSLIVSERTIYRLIDCRAISAMNIDLPRKVRFKPRKKTTSHKVDKACRIGRTYDDFLLYLKENPDIPIVELDSVEGKKGGKVLLTLHFVKTGFMLAFLREHNDSKSVIDIFNYLNALLGDSNFSMLFRLCLADNGTEFSNPVALEQNAEKKQRTRIYYCNPQAPYQKGACERNHEFIRCFIPKGTDLGLYDQAKIGLMMDHINSYCRESLGNKSPYEMFAFLYGKEILDLLQCHLIPPQEVTLNKSIFSKGGNTHDLR